MRKRLRTEAGYTLLIVLLTITIVGIMTPFLFTSVFDNNKQFQRSHEALQLRKLEDMGSKYMTKVLELSSETAARKVQSLVNDPDYNGKPAHDYKKAFEAKLRNFVNTEHIIYAEKNKKDGLQMKVRLSKQPKLDVSDQTITVEYVVLPSLTGEDYLEKEEQRKGGPDIYTVNLPEWF